MALEEDVPRSGLRTASRSGEARDPSNPREQIRTERGRYALSWLVDEGGTTELRPWAEAVAAWEEDASPDKVPRGRTLHFYSWLYFAFVPCLVKEGVVTFDQRRVEPAEDVSYLEDYLATVELQTR